MTKDTTFQRSRGVAVFAAAILAVGAVAALAQTPPASKAAEAAPANVLSLGEIESRLAAQGVKVKEIEVRDLLVEVEGYDAQGREVEIVIDRRSGETLSHRFDK